jgi:hypothetical protein
MTRQMPPAKLVAGVLAVTAVLVALLLVGSGEEDGGDPVPDEFTTFSGSFAEASFSFSYPAEWGDVTERPGEDERGHYFEAQEPGDPEGIRSRASLYVREEGASAEALLQANLTTARTAAADLEVSEQGQTEVPGAAEAGRASYTYTGSVEGEPVEVETELVIAKAGAGTSLVLVVTSSADSGIDNRAIADSLRIEGGGEPLGTDA